MAKVYSGEEISVNSRVGCTNVTDRQTTDRFAIAKTRAKTCGQNSNMTRDIKPVVIWSKMRMRSEKSPNRRKAA